MSKDVISQQIVSENRNQAKTRGRPRNGTKQPPELPMQDPTEKTAQGGEKTSAKENLRKWAKKSSAFCECGERLKEMEVTQEVESSRIIVNVWHQCTCGNEYMEKKVLYKPQWTTKFGEGRPL